MRRRDSAFAFLMFTAPLMAGSVLGDIEQKQILIERAVDDLMLRMQINIALREDVELSKSDLRAETRAGTVTLSGETADSRLTARAVTLAEGMDGVRDVRLQPQD